MTTGGKGLHVTVPLQPRNDWNEVNEFSRAVAEIFARAKPDQFTTVMSKAKRTGRIFIDYLRNARGATAIAPYSTRARPGATVATPLRWGELSESIHADHFTVVNFAKRLGSLTSDPWEGFHALAQTLSKATLRKLSL